MAGVRLHDHGVPGREGRGGVAAGDGEREGEVRCREHCDRADAGEHPSQFGARRGGGAVGVVDRDLEVRALLDDAREQAQLAGRAADLAAQAGLAEAGLLVGDRDELVGVRVECVGCGAQPAGAVVGRRGAPRRRGLRGGGEAQQAQLEERGYRGVERGFLSDLPVFPRQRVGV